MSLHPRNLLFRLASATLVSSQLEDTILVSGSGRSGTTWIAQALSCLPDYKLLFEPLNRDSLDNGYQKNAFIEQVSSDPRYESRIQDVLSGRISDSSMWKLGGETTLGRIYQHVTCQKLIVKCVTTNRILPRIASQFDLCGIILVLRHPCAVVASQLRYADDWKHVNPPHPEALRTGFGGRIPDSIFEDHASVLASIETTAGVLAARWCLDTYVPLEQAPPSPPWLIVPYERLLLEKGAETKRIAEFLGADVFDAVMKQLDLPSMTTRSEDRMNAQKQLTKWVSMLSPK